MLEISTFFSHKVILIYIQLDILTSDIFNGKISPDAVDFLLNPSRPLPLRGNSVKLFSKYSFVDDYNRTYLPNFPGSLYELKATDSGEVS